MRKPNANGNSHSYTDKSDANGYSYGYIYADKSDADGYGYGNDHTTAISYADS
jgi:hypothetical protein